MEWLFFVLLGAFAWLLLRPVGYTGTPETKDILDPILRPFFTEGIPKQYDESTPLLKLLKRRTVSGVAGEAIRMVVESSPNEAVGGRGEGDTLPVPGHAKRKRPTLILANHYGAFEMTGSAVDNARDNPDLTVDEVDRQSKALARSMSRLTNWAMYRDGSALLGDCIEASDAAGKTTIVVNHQVNHDGVLHLRPNMPVAVLLKSTGAVDDGVAYAIIESVSESACTITLDRTVSSAAGIDSTHGIYLHGSKDNLCYGFGAIFAAGNPGGGTDPNGYYGALDRTAAANAFWKGVVITNPDGAGTPRALTRDVVFDAKEEAEASGGEMSHAFMRPEVWRAWGNVLWPARTWQGDVKTIDAGYKAFEAEGCLFVKDRHAPCDQIIFAELGQMRILQNRTVGPLNHDGLSLRMDGRIDAWISDFVHRLQIEYGTPSRGAILKDLAVRVIPDQS